VHRPSLTGSVQRLSLSHYVGGGLRDVIALGNLKHLLCPLRPK